jgi:superfamily II DNA or RNA helicase
LVLVHNTFLRDQWIERIKSFLPNARIGIRNEDTSLDTFIQGFVIRVDGDVVKYKTDVHTPNFKLLKNMKPNEVEMLSEIMKINKSIESIENTVKSYTSVKDITIAMIQGVMRDDVSSSEFKNIGFVIVDECHHIASEAFSQTIPKITSKHMLGLSATPERKDRLMHVINWFLGPLLYKSDTSDKVDPGVFVEVYEFDKGDEKFNEVIYNQQGVMFTTLMINKLTDFQPRNKMIIDILTDIYDDRERQILVLSDRVDHVQLIYDILPENIRSDSCVLSRKVDSKTRTEWCETKRILIATYQMCKEGFDVPTLNTLVIATPRPDVDQIVGRILRVERTKRKTSPLIIDIVDPAFRRQFQERLSLYNKREYKVEKMKLE